MMAPPREAAAYSGRPVAGLYGGDAPPLRPLPRVRVVWLRPVIYLDADSFVVAPLDTLLKLIGLGGAGAYPRSHLHVVGPEALINMMENLVTRSEAQFDDVTAAQVLGHLDERSKTPDGETEGWLALDAKYALASSSK